MSNLTARITSAILKISRTINEEFFGSPFTYIGAVTFVLVAYLFLPVEGFQHWNTGIGLFANSLGSNLELIVDIGIAVTTVAIRRGHVEHKRSIAELHQKIDKLTESASSNNSAEGKQ